MRDRAVWLLRGLWFLVPLTAGSVISEAVASTQDSFAVAVTIGAWLLWGIGLVALAVPLPATLTVTRILVPGVPLAVVCAAVAGVGVSAMAVIGVVHASVLVAVAFSALIGDRFVDGGSYGNERRMLLRVPTRDALSAVPLAWSLTVVGAVAGPLLLADRRWVGGAIVAIAGSVGAAIAIRALHQMARRWVVLVPTGFVLHDLRALTEPVLFRRSAIERLGPAIEGTPARDLSVGAAGLLIECELADPAPLAIRLVGRSPEAEMAGVRRFLFVPSRPGDLLDEAESRGIAVG